MGLVFTPIVNRSVEELPAAHVGREFAHFVRLSLLKIPFPDLCSPLQEKLKRVPGLLK